MQVTTSYKDIWKLAYPVMISSLAMTIINITDTAFLGRVGEIELGASAIGGVLYFVFAMIGIAIGIGAQIMIARRAGENKDESIGEIVDHSLILLFILSTILFLFLKFGSPPLLNLILSSDELIKATNEFLSYRSFGIFAIMLATVFRSFFVGIARPNIYAVYSFLMAGVNIILGYTLIFGNFGFQSMGIRGAGLASTIAEFVGLLFLVSYAFMRSDIRHFKLFQFKNWSMELAKSILNLSAPIVIQNLLSMGAWFLFFVFMEKISSHDLAVSNIVRGAYMISMTPMWGLSIAANSMVSNIIGQGKQDQVLQMVKKIMWFGMIITAIMVLINILFPQLILGLFTNEAKLVEDAKSSLLVVDASMFLFTFGIVSISALSGTGATKRALLIEFVAIFVYLIYNSFVTFVLHGPAEILWMSEIVYWLMIGLASYLFIRSLRWKNIKV